MRKITLCLSILMVSVISLMAKTRKNPEYIRYIEKYHDIAIEQYELYRVPASITLAQGILESGAGKGRLAVEANNHFGIKCSNWKGARIYHDDDRRNECFRKYSNPLQSYIDHSEFLQKERYQWLFKLDPKDYKAWAHGLRKSGYATDRAYGTKLITLIETYDLDQYDQGYIERNKGLFGLLFGHKHKRASDHAIDFETGEEQAIDNDLTGYWSEHKGASKINRKVYKNGELYYVLVKENDTLERIADEVNTSERKLRKYNEIPRHYPLLAGEVIYLQEKLKKVTEQGHFHIVQRGESMHQISQKYGLRLKSLYSLNDLKTSYVPQMGDILRLN